MRLTATNTNISNALSAFNSITIANVIISDSSFSLGNVSITSDKVSVGDSVTNVSITPSTVTVPSFFLSGTQLSIQTFSGVYNYTQFTANGIWYNPYANSSVNSALSGYEQVLVMAWGAGGGGTSNNTEARGGGGGSCVINNYLLSSLPNTVSVTVGVGGTGLRNTTTAIGSAGDGGNTIFHTMTAYGGGGGSNTGGGGGAGSISNGGIVAGGPVAGANGNPGGASTFGGGGVANAANAQGGLSIFGGGGGAFQSNSGGLSIYGGGGGAASLSTLNMTGGTSIFGGAGGAANTSGVFAGAAPGGGGGASNSGVNIGGRGEVRVWVLGQGGTTAGAPTYNLTSDTTIVYEQDSVVYTISTTNVANGTTLYYTLNNSSNAVSSDFSTAVNGSVIINNNLGTFTLTANNDSDTANESIIIDIRTDSLTGNIVASNSSVVIAQFPALGEFFQGGYYAGNTTLGSNTYGTIIAPSSTEWSGVQWKTTNTYSTGGWGQPWANNGSYVTSLINNTSHPAAYNTRQLNSGGYNDWYLPSTYEIYLGRSGSLGVHALSGPYWSCEESFTQADAVVSVSLNGSLLSYKTATSAAGYGTFKVRAARRFLIRTS